MCRAEESMNIWGIMERGLEQETSEFSFEK